MYLPSHSVVGAGAFVEDRFDIAQIVAGHDAGDKVFFIDIVSDVQIDQLTNLVPSFRLSTTDIAISLVVQRFNDVAADHAGAACDDNHWVTPAKLLAGHNAPRSMAVIIAFHAAANSGRAPEYPALPLKPAFCRDICCNFNILSRAFSSVWLQISKICRK